MTGGDHGVRSLAAYERGNKLVTPWRVLKLIRKNGMEMDERFFLVE